MSSVRFSDITEQKETDNVFLSNMKSNLSGLG